MSVKTVACESSRLRAVAQVNGRAAVDLALYRLGAESATAPFLMRELKITDEPDRRALLEAIDSDLREEAERLLLEVGQDVMAARAQATKPPRTSGDEGGRGDSNELQDALEELNEKYAFIMLGGRSGVLIEKPDDPMGPGYELASTASFKELLAPHTVQVGDRRMSIASPWLKWPERREYYGIVFDPSREQVPGYYNLWRGFAVEPDPNAGTYNRLMDHLYENVCSGNESHFAWVIGWFAQMVQQPTKKLGTSIVIRGPQGAGKTIIGRSFGSLLGRHYTLVSESQRVLSRFNSHLASTLLLHLDEATWGGDRQAEGKLKDLVTGDSQLVEFKGKEPHQVRNYLRLLITGNSNWLIPAGFEERRFAVFDIGEAQIQNHSYFAAIEAELSASTDGRPDGGRRALLAYLLSYDLSDIQLRQIPRTDALLDQKLRSMTPEESWWVDVLMAGQLPGDTAGTGECAAAYVFDHYIEHGKKTGSPRRAAEVSLGSFLRKHAPGLGRARKPMLVYGRTVRVYAYSFPPLAACRAEMTRLLGHPISWPADSDEWAVDHKWGVAA